VKPVIAITVGDHNGVGPEVALKAISTREVLDACHPLLVGPPEVWEYYLRQIGRKRFRVLVHHQGGRPDPVIEPGKVTAGAGRVAAGAIREAVRTVRQGGASAVVTSPVSKQALHRSGVRFDGQTELLGHLTGSRHATMMLVSGTMRVGLMTIHVPLRNVPALITGRLVREKIEVIHRGLRFDFGISKPRIALLGLNPHAGEGGDIGHEERRTIEPAVRALRRRGFSIDGPFPADSFFSVYSRERYDAIVAMYHDQGLIPLKMAGAGRAVNVTLGLPIIRTSPDHGTGFDIAGKSVADPGSMIQAITLAARIVQHRRRQRVG
jgi:4-hydroxythreonine-4-phosphate dehydrogenase